MSLDLGGPGPGCSAARVRRLLAGELSGVEKERAQAHVAGCKRCAAMKEEIDRERAALLRDVPFPLFAAGVAEKLAQRPRRPFGARWAPAMAAAAGIALFAGVLLVLRPADTETVRAKGAASVQLYVHDRRGVRETSSGSQVEPGAQLMLALHPASYRYAAAVLLEPGEASPVYSGIAIRGTLPQAFEWTGQGSATILVVFADQPVDARRIRSAQDAPAGAEVVQVRLRR